MDLSSFLFYVSLLLIAWLGFAPLKRWRLRHIPGPPALPFLGNLPHILAAGGVHHYAQKLEKKYGRVFLVWFGMLPWVIVSDMEYARKVLFKNMNRTTFPGQGTMQGRLQTIDLNGLVFIGEQEWSVVRRSFEPTVLHPAALRGYMELMDGAAARLVARLEQFADTPQEVNIWRELGNMTMDVVGGAAFGVDLQCIPQGAQAGAASTATDAASVGAATGMGPRLAHAISVIMRHGQPQHAPLYTLLEALLPDLVPLLNRLAGWLPTRSSAADTAARWAVVSTCDTLMEDWKQHRAAGGDALDDKGSAGQASRSVGTARRGSFLDQVLSARSSLTGEKLTDDQTIAQAYTFAIAGYETTATALAFAVYLISSHPEAEQKLLSEVDAFGRDRQPTAEDIDKLPYLGAVLDETLRLYPSAPLAFRRTTQPQQLGDSGLVLPPGTDVGMMFWNIHRNEEYWPRAEDFIPERFLPGQKRSPAYLPFGHGPRMCVGYKFALQEARLALLRLYQCYTFRLGEGAEPMRTNLGITIGPATGTIPVRVQRRMPISASVAAR